MKRQNKAVFVFGTLGVLAAAATYVFDALTRNPFLVGLALQAALLLAIFRLGSSVGYKGKITTSRWLLAGGVMLGMFLGANIFAVSPAPIPGQLYDKFAILVGVFLGLAVVVTLRLLTKYWSAAPATAILGASALVIYVQLVSPNASMDRLIFPAWILSLSLLAGWWFVRSPPHRANER